MKENDWDLQPDEVPLNPAQIAQAAKATGQDAVAKNAAPITAPPQVIQAVKPQEAPALIELPNDITEVLEIVREGESMLAKIPSVLRTAKNARFIGIATALAKAKAHFFALQQGLPITEITADDHAACQNKRDDVARRDVWEILARGDHHVADLLQSHDSLAAKVEELTKDLEAATAPKK